MSECKSCFFIGHREVDERLLPRLELAVEWLIREENVRYFYVGGYGGIDRVAAAAVRRMKQKYPDITLMLVLPYHPAERPTEAPDGFDGTYHPDGLGSTPKRYAIVRANRIMINACDWLVCCVCHSASNSRKLLEYAQRRIARGLIQIENAEYQLGKMYCFGDGVPQDLEAGTAWLKSAADHGNPHAAPLLRYVQEQTQDVAIQGAFGLLKNLARMIRSEGEQEYHYKHHVERKLMQKIQEKKQALGIRSEQEEQGMRMQ